MIMPGWGEAFPQQLAGILAALAGMLAGSLMPQKIANHTGHVHHFLGSAKSA
jgi:SSS family solute:Na+ symporter